MDNLTNRPPATAESFWAAIQTLTEMQAETDRLMKENARRMKETDRRMKETDRQMKETDRQMKETDRQMKETDRRIDKVSATVGSWSYNQGRFAEEYFFNSFEKGKQNFFGEKFDEIKKNLKGIETDDEFDLVMLNGHSIGIIEIKFKAHENDIPKILKKVSNFKSNFPKYQNHKVYLGLATMSFYPELEKECIRQGIAVIKQVGDTIVINDKHLKAF